MTTGTKVIDNRFATTGAYRTCFSENWNPSGNQVVGTYIKKTWSGSNSIPSPSTEVEGVDYVQYRVFLPSGSYTWKRKSLPHGRLNKRSQLTENVYLMTYEHRKDNLYSSRTPCVGNTPPMPSQSESIQSTSGFSNVGFPPNFWTSDDDYSLYGRLSERIQGQAFNMAVFLGEGKEALGTMTEAARRITKAVKQVRKGRVRQAAEALVGKRTRRGQNNPSSEPTASSVSRRYFGALKNVPESEATADWVSSNWLQLQYGWLPLIGDIFNAARHFAWQFERDQPMVYRASLRKSSAGVSPAPESYSCRGSVYIRTSIKAIVTRINSVSLLGLADPASFLWEKTPWSFVADWILPISDYLEALNLDRSLQAKYVISRKEYQANTGASYVGSGSLSYSAGFLRINVRFERSVHSSLPVRPPQVKPLSEALSFRRAANAISLLIQAFK
jgi:hypothetical protein